MKRFWLIALATAALVLAQVAEQNVAQAQDSKYRPEIRRLTAELAKDTHKDATRILLATQLYLEASDLSMASKHDDAAKGFKAGLAVLQDRNGTVPENQPVYEETRYGLGYSALMLGQTQDAVGALDPLVASSPGVGKARYLLAAALLASGTDASFKRGLAVLTAMAGQNMGAEKDMAVRGATRWSYDLAVTLAAEGKGADALALMQDVRTRFGAASGANPAENQALQYGVAYFTGLTTGPSAAAAEYDKLSGQNAAYKLANGVTLKQVLSNAYYRAGLDALGLKTKEGNEQAVTAFNEAQEYGTGTDVDQMHGRALAYKNLGQADKMLVELARIEQTDPGYYKSINTGG